MALPDLHPLNEVYLTCHTASVGTTPIVARCVSPVAGRIIRVYSVLNGVITAADATITVAINGTTVTGATMTITQSGSAAGDVDTADPTTLSTSIVKEGDAISFTPSGATGASISCAFMAVIRRG